MGARNMGNCRKASMGPGCGWPARSATAGLAPSCTDRGHYHRAERRNERSSASAHSSRPRIVIWTRGDPLNPSFTLVPRGPSNNLSFCVSFLLGIQ